MDAQTETIDTLTKANTLRTELAGLIIERKQMVPEGVAACWEQGEDARRTAEYHGPDGLPWPERLDEARRALTAFTGALEWLAAADAITGRENPYRRPIRALLPSRWPDGSAGD
jgi:hypothetical protein